MNRPKLTRLSIRQKLIAIMMVVTMIALILTSIAFIVYDISTYRSGLEEELEVLAHMAGDNCSAALQFDDAGGAAEVLATFKNRPSITAAVLWKPDHHVFASYRRPDRSASHVEDLPPGIHWLKDVIWVVEPIQSRDGIIGTIALQSDLTSMDAILLQDILIISGSLLIAGLIAFVIASRLQRVIVTPIADLASTATRVTMDKDYSLRARPHSNDEVGGLTVAFNAMLEEIERRERSLTNYRDHLEELVEERTQRLKDTNDQLQMEMAAREKTQQRLIVAKEEAEKANRLKSQFLANMSHELRTPMNSILGFSSLLLKFDHPKVREFAETISRSGKRLMMLIDDVLDLSKVEAGKIRVRKDTFDLRKLAVIEDTVAPLLQGKTVAFSMTFDDRLPETVYSDETKMIQVLTNLIGNALKFTHTGFVQVRCQPGEQSDEILFSVKDSGIGIRSEHLESIFEEFYQVDKDRKQGSGLGLAICKQIVAALGGRIWVESTYGTGSTFYFTIKADTSPTPIPSSTVSPEEPLDVLPEGTHDGVRRHILVAEDEESNQKLYHQLLAEFDYTIVHNGVEVLASCRVEKPAIILMDIMMPQMDGEHALSEIRRDAMLKDIPVIAVTAKAMVGDREALLAKGFDGYLPKPIDDVRLIRLLANFHLHPKTQSKQGPVRLEPDQIGLLFNRLRGFRFFQSKEIKQTLDELIDGTGGDLHDKALSLLAIYKTRNESMFTAEVEALAAQTSLTSHNGYTP